MASREEKLAEDVLNSIKNEPHRKISQVRLIRATAFYEKAGDSLLARGVTDVARECLQTALVISTHHCRQYGPSTAITEKTSALFVKIAECFGREHLHDTAIYHLDLALKVNPQNLTAAFDLVIQFWAVNELEAAASLIHSVLATPRTSMHDKFDQLQFLMLHADNLSEVCRPNHVFYIRHGADTQGIQVTRPAASMPPVQDPAPQVDLQESEGACGFDPDEKVEIPPKKARNRSRSWSRSRSNSWSEATENQPRPYPIEQPHSLSKREALREAHKREKEMDRIRADILARSAREREKHIRKNSASDKDMKPFQNAPPPDFRHLLPGWGPRPVRKDPPQSTKKQSHKTTKDSNGDTGDTFAGGKYVANVQKPEVKREDEKRKPDIPPPFDAKFYHRLACSDCFVVHGYGNTECHYNENADSDHECKRNILLVSRKLKSKQVWVKVRHRPSMQNMNSSRFFRGKFSLCCQYQDKMPCRLGETRCTFAHSDEEREIWTMDMNETQFSLPEFIKQQQRWALENDVMQRKRRISNPKMASISVKSSPSDSSKPSDKPDIQSAMVNDQDLLNQDLTCPFQLEEICGTCWQTFGSMAKQKGNNCHTIGVNHSWESHRAFLLRPENELIRSFDPIRTKQCFQWENRSTCIYGNACTYIHGDAEFKVWHWMLGNGIKRMQDVVALSKRKTLKRNQRALDILKGEVKPTAELSSGSFIASRQKAVQLNMASVGPTTNPFCKVCNQYFSSKLEFDKHCTSRKHEKNLLTDREKPWHYRPPPWGGDTPRLCNGVDDNSCRFADVPDMYNQCPFAHSTLELDEWKERTRYWKLKKSIMKDPETFSYVHDIQNELAKVQSESDMMMDKVEGVNIEVTPDLTLYSNHKNCEQSWTFTLTCENEDLKRVCLLHDQSRLHFSLNSESRPGRPSQVEDGATFLDKSATGSTIYKVKVQFSAGLFGSFRQKVIFDFGRRPLLAVSLDVEVGNEFVRDRIIKLRNEHPSERWTSRTHKIIPFMPKKRSSSEKVEEDLLLCKYKPPDVTVFSQDSLVGDLSHNNYVHMMHRLVEMEELGRTQIASEFNVTADVELMDILPGDQEIQAPIGHLFGRVPLGEHQLSEDSDTGYLMLTGAVTAWVGPAGLDQREMTTPVIYEALVVCEANFGFDGRGKDHVYICLSKSCCTKLALTKGQCIALEVQLQIDRLPFCRMHYGLDQLPDTNIVFPDLSRYSHAMANSTGPKISSNFFNPTQLDIVQHMMTIRTQYTPPLVVYGPFGTGKTETLARATEAIVERRPESRILICALNDSAADLYVTRYFSKSNSIKQQEILRVFPPDRNVNTISPELQPYCQKEKGRFKLPDLTTIDEHRVIVTTLSTSLMLTDNAIRGRFTHILLDEAGQCLECEAIMPLTLATPTTCVVITGDHRQLGPKSFTTNIHSKTKLQSSILQRLCRYYSTFCKDRHPSALQPVIPPDSLYKQLNVNYRSHSSITKFVASNIYGAEHAIQCKSQWDKFSDFQPLAFYATCGAEAKEDTSTSYYNMSEVQELTQQIDRLYENWPESWGDKCPQKIAVLTPYSQQVKKVKESLFKKNPCYKDIRVTTVSDVQGEEFNAVFLSTVRTLRDIDALREEDTFGFFSDVPLLTTALTRAKCQVVVVGDPVSLSSCGRCMNIWRSYLEWCNQDGCLYPQSLTLQEIRLQVEFVNDKLKSGESQTLSQLLEQDIFDIAEVEADEIIQQLKLKSELDDVESQHVENCQNRFIEIIEDDEHTFFRVSAGTKPNKEVVYRRETKWNNKTFADFMCPLGKSLNETENDESHRESEDDEDGFNDGGNIYQDYTKEELLEKLKQDCEIYKRCLIRFEGPENMSAHNLNRMDKLHTISISSRMRCNRAFDGDEVVVEVLPTEKSKEAQGKVVGVLNRARNLKYCVCRVDPFNLTSFIPLKRGIPRINNLVQEWKKKKGLKATAVTVYSFEKGLIRFISEEKVDDNNPWNKLFLIRFLKWDAKFISPLGIVVKVIDSPTGLLDGVAALKYEYDLCGKYYDGKEDSSIPDSFTLPKSLLHERDDLRKQMTFTIDPKGSQDLDDALSVDKVKDGLCVSIHIADVSHFVEQDSQLDREAKKHCLSYDLPSDRSVRMLPEWLRVELTSFQPDKERLAITVFIFIDDKQYNVKSVEFKRSIIQSKHQLTYADVQKVLDNVIDKKWPKELTDSVILLNQIAKRWRSTRLGNRRPALYPRDGRNAAAHCLVEEMMIQANHEIATFLMAQCCEIVPLRIQPFPNKELFKEWKLRYQQNTQLSLGLEQPVLQLQEATDDLAPCENIVPPILLKDVMTVTCQTLQHMHDALLRKDSTALQKLAATTVLTPESALAEFAFRDIQERAEYRCSADLGRESAVHASLSVEPYTHFTAPIRRYIDIVAHREVTAALLKTNQPYTTNDVRETCEQNNLACRKQRMFEEDIEALEFNVLLKDQPLVVYPIVTLVEDDRICLRFPTVDQIQISTGMIMYSDLNLESLPTFDEETEEVVLKWDEQIYDYAKWQNITKENDGTNDVSVLHSKKHIKLDPNRFVVQIPASLWQDLQKCVQEENMSGLCEKTEKILGSAKSLSYPARSSNNSPKTATCNSKVYDENLMLELEVFKSQVHRVQLLSKMYKGKLTSRIQLLMMDNIDICIEHRQDPIECFANLTGLKVTRTFKTVERYLGRWQPLLRAEAAVNGVVSGDYYLLQNVPIKWTSQEGKYKGTLKLDTEFCEENQMFDTVKQAEEEYLCIRYSGVKVSQKVKDNEMVQTAMAEGEVCFVAHCLVKGCRKVQQWTVIDILLHQSSSPFPEGLTNGKQRATIQVINMPLPIKRMIKALEILKSKKMAKCLALGHRPPHLGHGLPITDMRIRQRAQELAQTAPGLKALKEANSLQQKAVTKSLTRSFSVIHGPPGTGKTVTGVRIAYLFAKLNQEKTKRNGRHLKVLYCGPSNKSVEVVIDSLKKVKVKDHFELVRVYSQDVLTIEYPDPTKLKPPRRLHSEAERKNTLRECRHDQFALHKLIRDPSKCPDYSDEIRKYDAMFRSEIERMRIPSFKRTEQEKCQWNEQVRRYNGLVFKASKQVLKKADIVLVTCVGAASSKVAGVLGDEINQVIIDEAGMCTEPEVMVPLTACEPEQVVLIGDHLQLQPIVKSELAQRLGMKTSLFERYVKEEDMLTVQYRMHKSIADFPSKMFYDGKLEIGKPHQTSPSIHKGLWPGGRQQRIVFVDIREDEMTQVISTADGNQQSKYNPKEAQFTAKVVKALVTERRIKPDCIQVMSQYRAQCKEIREHMQKLGEDVNVTTVVKSQGSEFDYVVFSTVRSLPPELIDMNPTYVWRRQHLGFTADPHQVNVALTRAKLGLIILGNRQLLSTCKVWSQLLKHYKEQAAITTLEGLMNCIKDK